MSASSGAKRGRGRPRAGESDARERIIAAAVEEFGARGYDGATMRSIAARAEVDPALLHHYFGTKADLFVVAADAPFRMDRFLPDVLEGPRAQVGERIVRFVLTSWDCPEVRARARVLFRAAMDGRDGELPMAQFMSRELLGKVAEHLDVPDADLRVGLAASQLMGLLAARYIVEFAPVAKASVDELVVSVGATLQSYLFD